MLYLPESEITIPQIAHCGTRWMRDVLTRAGVPWQQIGGDHGLGQFDRDRALVMVRHPAPWLRALWSHRSEGGRWDVSGDVADQAYAISGDDLHLWIETIAERWPGWCGELMGRYTRRCRYVCRLECAAVDLVATLRRLGQGFDAAAVYLSRPVKQTKDSPEVNGEPLRKLLYAEAETIKRYGY